MKSSAYLQVWSKEKFSSIQFDIAPKKSWDNITNLKLMVTGTINWTEKNKLWRHNFEKEKEYTAR